MDKPKPKAKIKAQKRQKDQFINRVIFAIFFTVIAFTVTVIAFNGFGLQVQDSLINMFFALITFELGALGALKVTKTVQGAKKTEEMGERGGDCGGTP